MSQKTSENLNTARKNLQIAALLVATIIAVLFIIEKGYWLASALTTDIITGLGCVALFNFFYRVYKESIAVRDSNRSRGQLIDKLRDELIEKAFYAAECHPNDETTLLIIKQHLADAVRQDNISTYQNEIEFIEKLN